MTTSEYNQIKEIFKPVKLVDELQKINNDISDITYILSTIPFNMYTARQKIESLNKEHPENHLFFFLINPSDGNFTPIYSAPSENLQQDLAWKKTYLEIKADAKTLDEIIQRLKILYNHTL